MIWDPSTLSRLSAPGFNRNLGAGDVVPYWPRSSDPGMAADAMPATPGVSFDPGGGGGSPVGNSFLNNLSALTPLFNDIFNQQQNAGIVSGQGNAQAQPPEAATPGIGSADISAQLGAVPVAGAPTVSPGIGTSPPMTGGFTSGEGAGTGGAPSGPSGESGGPAGDTGSAPGGTGGSGAGSGDSVLLSYVIRHLGPVNRRVRVFWRAVRAMHLATADGVARFQRYQDTARRVTAVLDKRPAAERQVILQALKKTLVNPYTRRATPADAAPAITLLGDTARALAVMYHIGITPQEA